MMLIAELDRERNPVIQFKGAEDMSQVGFDSAFSDTEGGGYLFITHALGNGQGNLPLPGRQLCQ